MSLFFLNKDLLNAKKYKYKGKDDSIVANLFLDSFSDYLIDLVPSNISPNIISLFGFILVLFSLVITAIFTDLFIYSVPFWLCFMNGIIIIIYLFLDNLDGRQARRLNISSPVGHFFDHGIGAFTTIIISLELGATFELSSFARFHFPFLTSIGFTLSSWEEYVTGSFYHPIINAQNEGLLIASFLQIANGVNSRFSNFVLNEPIFGYIFFFSVIVTFSLNFKNVIKKACFLSNGGSGEKQRRAIFSVLPILITIGLGYGILIANLKSSENFYYLTFACIMLAFHSHILITSYLINQTPTIFPDYIILAFWMPMTFSITIPEVNESPNYWGFMLFALLSMLLTYDIAVIDKLRLVLKIPVFTVFDPLDDSALVVDTDEESQIESKKDSDVENIPEFNNVDEKEYENFVIKI